MKPLAFILLLLHVNFSMFIAQIDERDICINGTQQVRDINSLCEYIQYSFSKDKHPHKTHDTDDDNARYFHALKPHFFLLQPSALVRKEENTRCEAPSLLLDDSSLAAGFLRIQSPPPKA